MTKTLCGSRMIYNFPGGGVENGEGFEEALIRECDEELQSNVVVKNRMYFSDNLYKNDEFPGFFMFNLYYDIETNTEPEGDIAWFPLDELPLKDMLEIDIEFVNKVFKKKTK